MRVSTRCTCLVLLILPAISLAQGTLPKPGEPVESVVAFVQGAMFGRISTTSETALDGWYDRLDDGARAKVEQVTGRHGISAATFIETSVRMTGFGFCPGEAVLIALDRILHVPAGQVTAIERRTLDSCIEIIARREHARPDRWIRLRGPRNGEFGTAAVIGFSKDRLALVIPGNDVSIAADLGVAVAQHSAEGFFACGDRCYDSYSLTIGDYEAEWRWNLLHYLLARDDGGDPLMLNYMTGAPTSADVR